MIETIGMLGMVGGAVALGLVPTRPLANCDPDSARAQLMRRAELRGTYALAVVGATVGFSLLAYGAGRPMSALLVGVVGALTFAAMHPWPLVRLAIPLGMWRVAFACSRLGGPPWMRDPAGGCVLAGVLACTRKRKPALDVLKRLEQRLADGPLRGAGIVAAALIAHERSDLDTARILMASVDDLEPDILPPFARRVAVDWRIADATARGEWGEVRRIGQGALWMSRSARFFVLVARRMDGVPARGLLCAWLKAPRRRHTWSLLREAQRATALPQDLVDLDREALPANGTGLLATGAASMHVEAARSAGRGGLDHVTVRRLGDAWDASLYDFDLRRRLRTRALELGCSDTVEEHVVALHRNLCRDIAAFLPRCPLDPPGSRRSLGRALIENRRLEQAGIGHNLKALADAQAATVGPPSWRVWTTWLAIRYAYERAAQGAPIGTMREVFSVVELAVAPFVGWLWMTRGERGLANAISFWLVCEAERVRLRDAAAHHRNWVAAGP